MDPNQILTKCARRGSSGEAKQIWLGFYVSFLLSPLDAARQNRAIGSRHTGFPIAYLDHARMHCLYV